MFNAKYFTYDGISSSAYGLQIASFSSNTVENTACFSPTLTTVKSSKSNRFFYAGIKYDTPPTATFSVVSETFISDQLRREILTWLVGRKEFKELVIFQDDLQFYHYNCIFTAAEIIYVNGLCHGFNLTATFDSPYQYTNSLVQTITGDGTVQTVKVTVDSDLPDEYTYPTIKFKFTDTLSDGKDISIYNTTDSADREFSFSGLNANTTYTVDNELKTIQGSGGKLLSKFSLKWLRLRKGVNELSVAINGELTLTVPLYVKIGF